MDAAAKAKGVILRDTCSKEKSFDIETDSVMLRTILESFISNAINYSEAGQEVILGLKQDDDSVEFSIKDSGIGIPLEEQGRIFERFYRASNAKKMKPDGTGLGLSFSLLIAPKINAKISFDSEQNKGSVFYLKIPKHNE
jgi:signal transduction histidine kinase